MREKIAVIFMVVSVIATVILGGAVAYELGKDQKSTVSLVSNGGAVIQPGAATGTSGNPTTGSSSGSTASGTSTGGTTSSGASTQTGTGSSQSGSSQSAASSSSSAAAAAASTQKVTGGVIKVGGLFDETGPVDATVERDTVRAYFNEVNGQGGVNGKTLQLESCDSKFNTTDGANCANTLIKNDHVFAIVGETAPNGEDATVHTFTSAGIPVVGGLGTPNEVADPLSFPVAPNFVTYGTSMGNRAADLGFTNVGIVVVNLGFIQPVENELKRTLAARGVKVVQSELVDATKANYADTVLDMQSHGAKSLVVALDPFSYERLFQSMQGAGFKPPFLGLGLDKGSVNPTPSDPSNGYGPFVQGMWSLTPFVEPADHPNDASVQTYINTVRKYFPNQVAPLDVFTEASWTSAQLFVDALRRAGPDPSQRGLVDALNATKNFGGGGLLSTPLSFAPGNHDPNRCFWMLQNKSSVWTTVTKAQCY